MFNLNNRRNQVMFPMLKFNRPTLANELFKSNFFDDLLENENNYSIPAVNIAEGKDEFRIEVAAPGWNKEDIDINLDHDILTISSHKEFKNDENAEKYSRREFGYSSFKRSFTLPESANTDKIVASQNNGILYITIPKRDEAKVKPARSISIA